MNQLLGQLFSPWTWRMALRDSRSHRLRLLFFATSISIGVGGLVGISGFKNNLHQAIELQSRSLLGSDLSLTSRTSFSDEHQDYFAELGGEQARETALNSMIYFPQQGGTRLVQVRAVEDGFPFYGDIETSPPEASATYQDEPAALVEESLLHQFGVNIGDPIQVGSWTTRVAGALKRVPGENVMFSTIAPRVYIPFSALPGTGLTEGASLARYTTHFKFPNTPETQRLIQRVDRESRGMGLDDDTVEERKRQLGRSTEYLARFLNMSALIALVLGGIGVASAIRVHVRSRLQSVAVLRCLGSSGSQAFAVYLAQAIALGFAGVMVGLLIGLGAQWSLPYFLSEFTTLAAHSEISFASLLQGGMIGMASSILFALPPLLTTRNMPALAVLRETSEDSNERDWASLVCYLLVIAFTIGLFIVKADDWERGLGMAVGLCASVALLLAVTRPIMAAARKIGPYLRSSALRHGLANLHRPQNKTGLLLTSLGLGALLILVAQLTQHAMLSQILIETDVDQPNAVLFDIQPDQLQAVQTLLQDQNLPVIEHVPIITMRLAEVRGRSVKDLLDSRERRARRWALEREYRSTYRATLSDTETLLAGEWVPTFEGEGPIPVSVEQEIADDLNVGLGDEMVFDVQGVEVPVVVTSMREVEWRRIQPNFFVVFPEGALNDAPGFHILVTRATSPEASAAMQRGVAQQFPNVSVIDLTLALQTIRSILDRINLVVGLMAGLIALTGALVLACAILLTRRERIIEAALLRTLGATRARIFAIQGIEFLSLGFCAALASALLATVCTWALCRYIFEMEFVMTYTPVLWAIVLLPLLTALIGFAFTWNILNRPPLPTLRAED